MEYSSRQLRAFALAAQHRSFTRASEALYITPSGLSVLIRELENQLGFRLFDRTTRHVSVTAAGEQLLAVVRQSLEDIDGAMSKISQDVHLLLFVQCSGWVQSFPRALGFTGVHARGRHRSDSAASQGEVPGREAVNHLRQWPAVHCSRLQGVHSYLGHDALPNLPYYPQSNGKIERWHKSLKSECIRPGTPLSLEDARRLVEGYVEHYNNVRLNSAIGYITPKDMLAGRQQEIHSERDRKLQAARQQLQSLRHQLVKSEAASSQ